MSWAVVPMGDRLDFDADGRLTEADEDAADALRLTRSRLEGEREHRGTLRLGR
jgi:hypothetical protein